LKTPSSHIGDLVPELLKKKLESQLRGATGEEQELLAEALPEFGETFTGSTVKGKRRPMRGRRDGARLHSGWGGVRGRKKGEKQGMGEYREAGPVKSESPH